MIINSGNLNAIRVGFSAAYMNGLGMADRQSARIATTVPSSTRENKYGWLGKMPSMREWIGARVVHSMAEHDYSIKNVPFELTIGVDRDDIKDDNLGTYTPMFTDMGESVSAKPDIMVFDALKNGFTTDCYDGQSFFDTDHPVLDENGDDGVVANTDGGAGTPWFLLSTKRSLKPIIYQEREKPVFVARDNPNDSNVFTNKLFEYGIDGRWNVGYGFWQMAWGSKQALDAAHFETAFAAIEGMKGDYGRPLGLTPDLLVVPPSLRSKGLELLNAERNAAGATNVWKDTAELLVVPWLA
ncbi:MAG: Mu-like prophage major head subunit gpT family protein [Amylibacter sp.]|nr:Mu-like prophage major head subunit gpT family protein [Amylibacter sp.]